MGGVAPNHGPQGDHHLVATASRQALGHQGDLKAAGHPGHIQLGTGITGVDTVTQEAVEAAAQQLAGHQVIKTGNHDRDTQTSRIGEPPFKNRHASDHKDAHAPVEQHQGHPGEAAKQDQAIGAT